MEPMAELIVALDHDDGDAALRLVDRLPGVRWVKVGATLYVREGPAVVTALRERGIRVFLDLKWYDIPHQVAGAVRAAAGLGVELATVHALGGVEMLGAAAAAAGGMRLVAVTVLTSHTAATYGEAVGRIPTDMAAETRRLAELAVHAGLDGVVSAAGEVAALRRALGPGPWLVVPGIRPAGAPADDQRRTAGAREAVDAGATHLVVGRPITGAADPIRVYEAMCKETG
jgi:orotidine-5'-phosphate decarboxylase